jgi:hypothetical protein
VKQGSLAGPARSVALGGAVIALPLVAAVATALWRFGAAQYEYERVARQAESLRLLAGMEANVLDRLRYADLALARSDGSGLARLRAIQPRFSQLVAATRARGDLSATASSLLARAERANVELAAALERGTELALPLGEIAPAVTALTALAARRRA